MRTFEFGPMNRRSLVVPLMASLALMLGCQQFSAIFRERGEVKPIDKEGSVVPPPGAPSKYSFRIAPYVFLSDFEIKPDLPLFKELAGLRDQLYAELKQRGMGGADDLFVYTFWDAQRIQQDLRHELTHALLHSVLKDVPLWLDEGLAEYFELPPESRGVNRVHVEHLRHDGRPLKLDLARLETVREVKDMTAAEYRESWAWVHFLLRGHPEAKPVLLNYLAQLRHDANPPPLSPQLLKVFLSLDDLLDRHLAQLDDHRARVDRR
jgi:hypothetical protein